MTGGLGSFRGLNITTTFSAMERKENWPAVMRSKRLTKKMTKRLGPQFSYVPGCWETPGGPVMHPDLFEKLKLEMAANAR